MSALQSLRRTAVGVAAGVLLVGGVLGFASAAGNAGAEVAAPAALPAGAIALNNNQATAQEDCPDDGFAYWHFILAPNNGTYAITSISLDLGTETLTFSGSAIVPNGGQTDNVFVAVPAGHTLTDIVLGDSSYALYSGGTSAPSNFTLSHTCEGAVPTTTTPSTSSTTSTVPTSSTKVTTSTTSTSTTSTTAPSGPTSTTTTEPDTTTTEEVTTTTEAEVLGTVQTTSTTAAEAATAVQADGELPYTGTDTAGMVAAGLSVLLGGALLVGLARTKSRTLAER
jgi:LPXTG-motif cell wall-anchored protein